MEDLLQEFVKENCSINVEFLENKTGEITVWAYLLSIAEIKNIFPKLRLVLYLSLTITFYA